MKVEPIIELKNIKSIKKLLSDNHRDRLLFIMGINSGLRVQDLLALKISDVKSCKVGDRIAVKEKKTSKENVFIMNKEIFAALQDYLDTIELIDDHFLFKSRKGRNYPSRRTPSPRWCNDGAMRSTLSETSEPIRCERPGVTINARRLV